MPRKPKLTEVEIYYIKGKVGEGVSLDVIASELNRKVAEIERHAAPSPEPEKPKPGPSLKAMQTSVKGVTIMTPAAAERADEFRKTGTLSRKYRDSVQKIFPD
jgi:hypothetical protein